MAAAKRVTPACRTAAHAAGGPGGGAIFFLTDGASGAYDLYGQGSVPDVKHLGAGTASVHDNRSLLNENEERLWKCLKNWKYCGAAAFSAC